MLSSLPSSTTSARGGMGNHRSEAGPRTKTRQRNTVEAMSNINLEQDKEAIKELSAEEHREFSTYLNLLLAEAEDSEAMTPEERAAKFDAAADDVFARRADLLRRLAE